MNNGTKNLVWPVMIAVLALVISGIGLWQINQAPGAGVEVLGVTNLDSLHLSDSGGTATPVLMVNQDGTGVIAEFRDASTPVAQILDGGSLVMAAGFDLNGQALTIDADGDTTLVASFDDTITTTLGAGTGLYNLLTGNLKVGNGTPDTTLDGEDAYVEGTLEVDGATNFDGAADFASTIAAGSSVNASADVDVGTFVNLSAQASLTLAEGGIITPTGTYQLIDSASPITTSTATPIATAGREAGDLLIIRNSNAADAIIIDGTGGTVECKANVSLGASDTLTLIYNGSAWNCVSSYDNS